MDEKDGEYNWTGLFAAACRILTATCPNLDNHVWPGVHSRVKNWSFQGFQISTLDLVLTSLFARVFGPTLAATARECDMLMGPTFTMHFLTRSFFARILRNVDLPVPDAPTIARKRGV